MINEEKVGLMSHLALFEQKKGREALKLNRLFDKNSASEIFRREVPFGIITFILAVVFVLAFRSDWLFYLMDLLGTALFAVVAGLVFVAFVAGYCFFSRAMWRPRYENTEGNIWKYNYEKERLNAMLTSKDSEMEENNPET